MVVMTLIDDAGRLVARSAVRKAHIKAHIENVGF
jgi:hypothetical protein